MGVSNVFRECSVRLSMFYEINLITSAVSSTNLGSIRINSYFLRTAQYIGRPFFGKFSCVGT